MSAAASLTCPFGAPTGGAITSTSTIFSTVTVSPLTLTSLITSSTTVLTAPSFSTIFSTSLITSTGTSLVTVTVSPGTSLITSTSVVQAEIAKDATRSNTENPSILNFFIVLPFYLLIHNKRGLPTVGFEYIIFEYNISANTIYENQAH